MGANVKMLRRVLSCTRGSNAIEFALVVPVFTVMLFSIIEYGFVFVAYGAMRFAATTTARQIGVNALQMSGASASAKSKMPPWVANASTVTTVATVNPDPLKSTIKVTVSAPVSTATPLPLFTMAPYWVMSTSVTVRQELPYVG